MHWGTLLLAAIPVGVGVFVFRNTYAVYLQIFFARRALRYALAKTFLMLVLLLAIYGIPTWLFNRFMPPSALRPALAFGVAFTIFNAAWGPAGRMLDRIFVGR